MASVVLREQKVTDVPTLEEAYLQLSHIFISKDPSYNLTNPFEPWYIDRLSIAQGSQTLCCHDLLLVMEP